MMKKYNILMGIALLGIYLCSCSEDQVATEYDYDKHYVHRQPVTDEVNTNFSGKVALLQPNSDMVMEYLKKRFINTSTELTADADAVVLDESRAKELLDNATDFDILKSVWDANKVFVFINPSTETYLLVKNLRFEDVGKNKTLPTEEDLQLFENIHVYATRADGSSFFHEKVDATSGTMEAVLGTETETGDVEEQVEAAPFSPQPNDYNKGRLAENLTAWLKAHALVGEQRNVAFTRTDSDSYQMNTTILTFHRSITINHDWITEYCKDARVPNSIIVQADIEFQIHGAYSTDRDCDVYDINMYEVFPANDTWTDNVYVYEKGAYDYKYMGGCYMGPDVKLYLKDIPASSVQVEEVAPLPQTNGSYNNTHYPMQIGFGASLEGNISTKPGLSAGLSMGITLPTTTTSFNHAEMPISFNKHDNHAEWNYCADLDIYTARGWLNPKLNDYPDVVKSYCKTDQAVTFLLNNAKKYEEKDIRLGCEFTFKTHNEYAENNLNKTKKYYYSKSFSFALPKVNRYFEKYTPYPLPSSTGSGDGPEWGNLEERLMRNINYRALCDNTLMVGAQTIDGLDETATRIWRNALDAIVAQYDETVTDYEYVIGLAKSNGEHIPLGLHIKDGVWRVVDDVDNIGE